MCCRRGITHDTAQYRAAGTGFIESVMNLSKLLHVKLSGLEAICSEVPGRYLESQTELQTLQLSYCWLSFARIKAPLGRMWQLQHLDLSMSSLVDEEWNC